MLWTARLRLSIEVALVVALAITALVCAVRGRARDRLAADVAAAALEKKGFHEVEVVRKPSLPSDVPKTPGVRPIARVRGAVDFGPARVLPSPVTLPLGPVGDSPSLTAPGLPPTSGGNCPQPTAADLRGGCDTSIVLIEARPFARTTWWAEVRLADGSTLKREALLEPLEVEVARSIQPPRWRLDALVGLSTAGAIEAGAAWTGKSRLGGYALWEYDPARGSSSVHGGLRWRLK